MKSVILSHGNPFLAQQDEVINVMTKAVMKEYVEADIVNRDQIGQEAFEEFVKERINTGQKVF